MGQIIPYKETEAYARSLAFARERMRRFRARNPDRVKEIESAWKSRNPDYHKEYIRKRRETDLTLRATQREYDAQRAARELQATPAWADKAAIAAIYKVAVLKSALTGQRYEVDHIVPLRGKTACGLYVESNLRVIPAGENRRKANILKEM